MNEEKKCSFSIYRVLLITALVVFLLLTFLQPWNSDIRPEAYKVLCMANLQYLNMAILEYTTGNNGILPESEKWCDLIADSNWIRPKTYICKGSNTVYCESSYAMNDNLSDFIITDITGDVVLLFETNSGIDPNGRTVRLDSREFYKIMEDRGFLKKNDANELVYKNRWNQCGGPEILTCEHHGGKGCNVLFANGEVRFVNAKNIDKLRWEVNEVAVELKIGDKAPAIDLLDQDGSNVKLSDYKGKKVLVYFYPKADTPGCTKQSCSVRDSAKDLKKAGVVALGISPDAPDKQKKFDDKYNLGFTLLCDTEHKVSEAYGVWQEKSMYGKKYMGIVRSSFLIDEKGKLIGVWYKVKPDETIPKALEALK